MKVYSKPIVVSDRSFETNALACGKTPDPPPGSWHFAYDYETFTGHFGPGFGGSESQTGSAGLGFGPGGASNSGTISIMCGVWITLSS